MKLSRRNFLKHSTLYFCFSGSVFSKSLIQKKDEEWETSCKVWIQILIPETGKNKTVHSQQILKQIQLTMADSKKTALKIKRGFSLLKKHPTPTNSTQLNRSLQQRSGTGRFLRYFFDLVLEFYYGSEAGWADLGLYAAPQPNGFIITSSDLSYPHRAEPTYYRDT